MPRLPVNWRNSVATIREILDCFETFAPVGTAMDFDNVGLLAGDKDTKITSALLALDITAEVVEEAAALGCELIISHHPVIFQPLKRLDPHSAAYLLAKYGIAAVCMHTNLDLSEAFGVNTCLAAALDVKNLRKSAVGECLFVGELPRETDMLSFAKNAKAALDCKGLRYTAVKERVKTVAVASGAGGSDIFAAAAEHADVLVTGEIKHHEINAANELGVNILDAGHFKSENVVFLPLKNRLADRFSDITFTISQAYDDKVNYL